MRDDWRCDRGRFGGEGVLVVLWCLELERGKVPRI